MILTHFQCPLLRPNATIVSISHISSNPSGWARRWNTIFKYKRGDPDTIFKYKRMKITTGMLSERCLQQPGLCRGRCQCLAHLYSKFRNHKLGKTLIMLQPFNTKGFRRKWQLFLVYVGPHYPQTKTMQKDTLYFLRDTNCLQRFRTSDHNRLETQQTFIITR